MCRSAAELDGSDPWDALNGWFEGFIAYIGTKRALAAELSNYLDQDAPLFQGCRTSLFEAGEPLLKSAQDAGVVRPDVTIGEVIQMVVGIAKMPAGDPEQNEHILRVALDGLRYQLPRRPRHRPDPDRAPRARRSARERPRPPQGRRRAAGRSSPARAGRPHDREAVARGRPAVTGARR